LADVAGTLPLALGKLGIQVLVMMPKYRGIDFESKRLAQNVELRTIANEGFYNRYGLYNNERGEYPDNLERFIFFCRHALMTAKELRFRPDIVHANDWQTAMLPVYLKEWRDPFFKKTKSLLTIHNLAYQGQFGGRFFGKLGLPERVFSSRGVEFYGRVNLLKGGLLYADGLSTVSPTYAEEIQTREHGGALEGVIRSKASVLRGILNGLDYSVWNPRTDKKIKRTFSPKSLEGKKDCKADLQASSGLPVNESVPLFAMVSRLAEQKGLDVVTEAADEFLSKNVQFVLLGDGDRVYHRAFRNIAARHPGKVAVYLGFNAAEAHQIYAGADFFLMPSNYEPCGLGQLIAMKYGTLPIVHRTGGLADTVLDAYAGVEAGNGICMPRNSPGRFLEATRRAIDIFNHKDTLRRMRLNGMKADFSWKRSAGDYVRFYRDLVR